MPVTHDEWGAEGPYTRSGPFTDGPYQHFRLSSVNLD